jgi:hypothetical protein
MAMQRTNRTDQATAFACPSIRSSRPIAPCFDPLLEIPPAADYSDMPVGINYRI